MLRRLLTCLALITGLAAAGAPVQAALVVDVGASMETSGHVPSAGVASPRADHRGGILRMVRTAAAPEGAIDRRTTMAVPTVQLKADRALE